MRRGVLILRAPATVRRQSQACLVLSQNGFSCRATTRFDGTLMVPFARDDDEPDVDFDLVKEMFVKSGVWDDADTEMKDQDHLIPKD